MQKLSEADIRLITHKAELRKAELDNLFGELKITAADIDNGRRNADTTDFKLQSSAILRSWVQKKGKYANRNVIIDAFRECDLTDAAELLKKKFSETVTSDMKESGADFDLHECQEELRAYYLNEMGKVNMLPWIPEESRHMESTFVELDLVRKEESNASQYIKNNEDLVTLKTNQGQRINRVLVTGDAGSGKSITTCNLAYKWAKNYPQSPLSKFSLVFMIRMTDIDDSSLSLVDLIFEHILSEDSNVSKEGLNMYIKENAIDVLIIIDAVDEDSSGVLKNKSSGITKLLHNRKLRKSCVILTTRPRNVSDLETHASRYTQVKLEGFSVKNIRKYIGHFFQDNQEKVSLLFKKFDSEPHILALASIPVLLPMICMLWEHQHTTPKTKTQLYQQTIGYLWRRYKGEDQARDDDLENDDFEEELKDLLNKLGEVALRKIEFDSLSFTEKEFGKDACDLGWEVGILKKELARAGIKRNTSVTFAHATFQFFCAAFHLAHVLNTKQKKLDDFDGMLFSISKDKFLYKPDVLEFCCGIQPEVTTTIIQVLTERYAKLRTGIKEPIHGDITMYMKLIFEGQLPYEECSNLIPLFSSFIARIELTHDRIPSVLYMLELHKSSAPQTGLLSIIESLGVHTGCTPWLPTLLKHTTNLYFCDVFLGDSGKVTDLDMMYKALSELANIKVLRLIKYIMHASLIYRADATNLLNYLTEKRVKLTEFQLLGFQFDEKVMVRYLSSTRTSMSRLGLRGTLNAQGQLATINHVIEQFPHLNLKHLNQLVLSYFQINSATKHLRPLIAQLEVLTLQSCRLCYRHFKELFSFLSRAQKLKTINLSQNLLSVAAVQALVESLKSIPALETLLLHDTGLNDTSACILARFVRGAPSINTLCLDGNPGVSNVGKDALKGLPLKRLVSTQFEVKYEDI